MCHSATPRRVSLALEQPFGSTLVHREGRLGVLHSQWGPRTGCQWSDIASPQVAVRRGRALSRPAPYPTGRTPRSRRKENHMAVPVADRSKALEAALGQIDRQFGKGERKSTRLNSSHVAI